MRMSGSFGAAAVIVLLAGSTCASFGFQTATASDTAPPSQSALADSGKPFPQPSISPTSIPILSIAVEVQSTHSRLRRIRLELDKAVRLPDVEKRLEVLAGALQRIHPALAAGDISQVEQLANFSQELRRFRLQIEDLQKDLIPRSRTLEDRREELRKMEWHLAGHLSVVVSAAGGGGCIQRTHPFHSERDRRCDEQDSEPPTVLLTIQNRVLEKRIAVEDLLAQTEDAIDQSRARLLTLDSEPLWRMRGFAESGISATDSMGNAYSHRVLPLLDYLRDNKSRLWAHLLISLLLLWLLIAVSRESRKWLKQAGGEDKTEQVLRHPVAATLVLSILLSIIFYPMPP